ncbi:MAG TPA: NAD(P)-dependent oxidoreductase [Chthoniobacterales bacterium]
MKKLKIYISSAAASEKHLLEEMLPDFTLEFVDSLRDVPRTARMISIFFRDEVNEAFLDAHPSLRVINSRSTTLDHVDLKACAKRRILVRNVPTYGENTVAEHTFALLLAVSRRLRECYEAVGSGRFNAENLRGFDLRGKTIGIIGAGRIGLQVIRIAKGFGMRVLAYDEAPKAFYTELMDFTYVPPGRLLAESDVLSLHVPLTETNHHWLNRERLEQCKPGVVIINTARGALVDTEALLEALESGQVAAAGCDVLEEERVFQGGVMNVLGIQIAERLQAAAGHGGEKRLAEIQKLWRNSALLKHPRVVFTPHVAYNSDEAIRRLCEVTASQIREFAAGA